MPQNTSGALLNIGMLTVLPILAQQMSGQKPKSQHIELAESRLLAIDQL